MAGAAGALPASSSDLAADHPCPFSASRFRDLRAGGLARPGRLVGASRFGIIEIFGRFNLDRHSLTRSFTF